MTDWDDYHDEDEWSWQRGVAAEDDLRDRAEEAYNEWLMNGGDQ